MRILKAILSFLALVAGILIAVLYGVNESWVLMGIYIFFAICWLIITVANIIMAIEEK